MATVDVEQIDAPNGTAEARLGNEVRNALIFGLTGGWAATSPAYRLKINISGEQSKVIVDTTTARPDMEILRPRRDLQPDRAGEQARS